MEGDMRLAAGERAVLQRCLLESRLPVFVREATEHRRAKPPRRPERTIVRVKIVGLDPFLSSFGEPEA